MDFLNVVNYVNYLHQEHLELKRTYATLLSIVVQELPGIKAKLEVLEKHNLNTVQKKNHHPEKRMICQYCGENFDLQWKLESHLVMHVEAEEFPCNICDKTFQTNWRLQKHMKNHDRKNVRVCKYFKKGQFCPFEKVGCKFAHRSSKIENEVEKITDDHAKDENHHSNTLKNKTTTMEETSEHGLDYRNENSQNRDCQGCGQFPDEFMCVECSGRFCSECILQDHMKNLHYCLNCGDDDV